MQDPARRTKGFTSGKPAPEPSWLTKPPKTVEQTPLNQYIRKQEDLGGRVSEPLKDTAGVRDAARRGQLKPVQAGESKPTAPQGRVSRVRLKGDLAAAGVDTSPAPSQRSPRNVRLADTTKGGPVKTIKPAPKPEFKVTTAPTVQKPEPIKQSEVSKRAARFRQSFGTPTGADPFTGRATYRPLDAMTDLPKGRGGRAPSPDQYSKTKVGDLDAKRILRTMGPKGTPTTRGVENFALNRETQGRFSPSTRRGRTLSPSDSKAAVERVKATMADPKKVADIKGRISQEVGGRRAQVTSPNPVPSRSTSAATGSTTAVRRVRVKVEPPQTLRRAALPPASSAPARSQPSAAPVKTMTKVKQSLNLSPSAPEPSFRVSGTTKQTKAPQLPPVGNTTAPKPTPVKPVKTNTPGQSLEFGKTRSGSFTYKPGTTTSTTPPRTAPPAPVADPTRRRASGNAGPSSRIDSGPKTPATPQKPVTPQQMRKATQVPNLGQGSTSPRQGTSVSYKPPQPTATKPPTPRASSGVASGAFYGVFNAMSAAEREKARGQTAERQRDAAIASGTGSTLGSAAATRALSSVLGPKAKAVTNLVAPIAGSMVGDKVADYVMGASKSDRQWMARQNRLNQTGVPGQSATSRRGNRAVVRDASGKERVGYLAYKDGKPVYKTANDPSSLAYTSSNPLERVGRRTADAGVPYVSDWLKGYYGRKDDATRRANVAAQKARAGN
tara:strand:+ start:10 stop:2178 length:2169 start_codon:yes stop_codon:yes gene_type:complete